MTSIPTFPRLARSRAASPATASASSTSGGHERLLVPVAVVVALLLGVVGWMLLVAPVRGDAASARDQATTAAAQADTLQSRLAGLRAQQGDLPRYQAEFAAAQAALPTTAALPAFLRTLQDLGASTGTSVTSLTATEPGTGTGATVAGPAGVGTVYRVPVTVTVAGSDDGLAAFVAGLQNSQPRAVLVDTVNESTTDAAATTLTLSMTAFVAPTAGASGNGG